MSSAVAQLDDYKDGLQFDSARFIQGNSWNGRERNLLFVNGGDGTYFDAARPLGCDEVEESRGVALADLDRDGRLDVVVGNNDASPTVYLNRLPGTGNWCSFRLVGAVGDTRPASNRDALGARVVATVACEGTTRRIMREVQAGSGFTAQSEGGVRLGLGVAGSLETLEIEWPSGRKVTLERADLEGVGNRCWLVEEGRERELRPVLAGRERDGYSGADR